MNRYVKIGGIGCGVLGVLILGCIAVFAIISPSTNKSPVPVSQTVEETAQLAVKTEVAQDEGAGITAQTAAPVPTDAPVPADTPTHTAQTLGKVGERVESAGIALTVLNVQKVASAGFTTAKEGNILLDIEVALENTNRDEAPYNPMYFKVKDGQNYEYDTTFGSLEPSLQSGTLKQGELARGHVTFEVPKTASGLVVSYEPLVLFGGYEPLRVNLEETADQPVTAPQGSIASPDGKVGERVESAGVAITVLKVQKTTKIDFLSADAGNIFVDAEVVIQNAGRDETTPFNPMYFKLKDGDGYEYNSAMSALFPSLQSGELDKDDIVRGHVAFEVPEKSAGLVMSYEPMVLFGGYQPIKIYLDQDSGQTTEVPKPLSYPAYTLGTPVESAGISLNVLKVQTAKSAGGISSEQGKIYLDLEVEIKNVNRSETTPYNPLYFKVKDGEGYEYSPAMLSVDPALTAGDLAQGDVVRGHVAFEIPESAKGLAVSYVPEVLFGGYKIIHISLNH